MAIAFYETPSGVADLLCGRLLRWLTQGPLSILDACAGRGVLGLALISHLGKEAVRQAMFIELDAELAAGLQSRLVHAGPEISVHAADILGSEAAAALTQADVVIANPPFLTMNRWRQVSNRSIEREGKRFFPDVSCYIVLQLTRKSRPGTILGFIVRRELLTSSGYAEFRTFLDPLFELLDVVDLGRQLIPGSGSAESVILIGRRRSDVEQAREPSVSSWGKHPLALHPPPGWLLLSDVASVRAGPSVRSLEDAPSTGQRLVPIAVIPPRFESSKIWSSDLYRVVDWDGLNFAARRNMAHQGKPGFVYKLAGKRFVTAILPTGHRFLSNCPAVQPKLGRNLDFVTGCGMLSSWRMLVRECVLSKNLSPLSVAQVPVPTSSPLMSSIEALGRAARAEGEKVQWSPVELAWPAWLKDQRDAVDDRVREVLADHLATLR